MPAVQLVNWINEILEADVKSYRSSVNLCS